MFQIGLKNTQSKLPNKRNFSCQMQQNLKYYTGMFSNNSKVSEINHLVSCMQGGNWQRISKYPRETPSLNSAVISLTNQQCFRVEFTQYLPLNMSLSILHKLFYPFYMDKHKIIRYFPHKQQKFRILPNTKSFSAIRSQISKATQK